MALSLAKSSSQTNASVEYTASYQSDAFAEDQPSLSHQDDQHEIGLRLLKQIQQQHDFRLGAIWHSINAESIPRCIDDIKTHYHLRAQQLTLEADWFRGQYNVLLAYSKAHNNVVLLYRKATWLKPWIIDKTSQQKTEPTDYVLYDPVSDSHSRLTASLLETLETQAYLLYETFEFDEKASLLAFSIFSIRPFLKQVVANVLIGVMISLITTLGLFISYAVYRYAIPDHDQSRLLEIAIMSMLVVIAGYLIQQFQSRQSMRLSNNIELRQTAAVLDFIIRSRISLYQRYNTSELMQRLSVLTGLGAEGITLALGSVSVLIGVLINLAILCVLFPELALVALGIGLIVMIINIAVNAFYYSLQVKLEIAEAGLDDLNLQIIAGQEKIQAFYKRKPMFSLWQRLYEHIQEQRLSMETVYAYADQIALLFKAMAFAITIFLFGRLLTQENGSWIHSGAGITLLPLFFITQRVFSSLIEQMTGIGNIVSGIYRFKLRRELVLPFIKQVQQRSSRRLAFDERGPAIALDRVRFQYPDTKAPIIDNYSLSIAQGECIALCGESGVGKSTLIKLMLGQLAPQSGYVFVGGAHATDILNTEGCQGIASIQDNDCLLAGSIGDNVRMSRLVGNNAIWSALQDANMHEDVLNFGMGLDTIVAEQGKSLSGGQRQRLLLARALIGNPKVLILDEALSGCHHHVQMHILDSLRRRNITVIYATHDMKVMQLCDQVLFMQHAMPLCLQHLNSLVDEENFLSVYPSASELKEPKQALDDTEKNS